MLPLDEARAIVARHFRVYDAREERIQGDAKAQMFYLMFPAEEFDTRYDAVREGFRERDEELVVFLRSEGGEDVLLVAERPPAPPARLKVHALLLGLTILTTMTAGALLWASYTADPASFGLSTMLRPRNLLWGLLTFALPLLLILGLHEMAHNLAARRHGLRATLPYFIPVPPVPLPIGTFGAFIAMRDPMPDRRALFDIGASGPLVGFLTAVPVVILGAMLTNAGAVALPDADRPEVEVPAGFEEQETGPGLLRLEATDLAPRIVLLPITAPGGDEDWPYTLTVTATVDGSERTDTFDATLDAGAKTLHRITVPADATAFTTTLTWDDGLITFGDPLLVKALDRAGLGNQGYLTHPTFFAGWVGLLVTGINLLPVGQLDGGHVARAMLGERMRYVAYGAMAFLLFLVLFMRSAWFLMALFILLIGVQHAPPLNDRTPLDRTRVAVGILVLLVFVVTFVPQPIIV